MVLCFSFTRFFSFQVKRTNETFITMHAFYFILDPTFRERFSNSLEEVVFKTPSTVRSGCCVFFIFYFYFFNPCSYRPAFHASCLTTGERLQLPAASVFGRGRENGDWRREKPRRARQGWRQTLSPPAPVVGEKCSRLSCFSRDTLKPQLFDCWKQSFVCVVCVFGRHHCRRGRSQASPT